VLEGHKLLEMDRNQKLLKKFHSTIIISKKIPNIWVEFLWILTFFPYSFVSLKVLVLAPQLLRLGTLQQITKLQKNHRQLVHS